MNSITKILVANRGEVAVRVIRSAHQLGYPTVAVYSEADELAPHVAMAGESICIGPPPATESYLNQTAIIDACRASKANAVHPGYGFLAENGGFARRCREKGLIFIGPDPQTIELMGNKREAKDRLAEEGIACVPGFNCRGLEVSEILEKAEHLGFPLMVKAASGGGGKGLRTVRRMEDLNDAVNAAKREAMNAFGDDEILIEEAIVDARHVEVQIIADRHGYTRALGDRDCSIQRRHQKLIEEAPAPGLDQDLRRRMAEAAVKVAVTSGYVGLGTVEFLLASDGAFYFLEMNTRLQVEHPVTEMIYGLDLVALQIRVAAGESLEEELKDVAPSGHAIEARLCAELPEKEFMPQTGYIARWRPAEGPSIRIDHGLCEGLEVTSHYDSLLAKLIASGPSREVAMATLATALKGTSLFGVGTNQNFLLKLLSEPRFVHGPVPTSFLSEFNAPASDESAVPWSLACALIHCRTAGSMPELWRYWQSGRPVSRPYQLQLGPDKRRLPIIACEGRYLVDHDDEEVAIRIDHSGTAHVAFDSGQGRQDAYFHFTAEGALHLRTDQGTWFFRDVTLAEPIEDSETRGGRVEAVMSGKIIQVMVEPGDSIKAGHELLILSAMKMENRIVSPVSGVVESLHVTAGDQVSAGDPLVDLATE